MTPSFPHYPVVLLAVLCAWSASGASAQTRLKQELSHVDLGIQATGEFTGTAEGPVTIPANNQGQIVSIYASSTVGGLATLRYTPKPYIGAELNAGYARYTENLSVQPLTIQTQADEFSLGYLVTPPYTIFGVRPYASAGVGGMRFAPTAGGGEGAPHQGRLALYYHVGAQKDILPELLGIRVGFREVFFTAPDFFQNYITINKKTQTLEPTIGLYLRF